MNEETRKALELAREVLEQSDPKWGERIRAMSSIDAALTPAAPALQALTDEQASTLWRKHLRVSETDGHSIHGGVELIRAIERAHGIGQGGAK